MMRIQFQRGALALLLLSLWATATPTANPQQDPTFRLMTLERRVDQLQNRVDFLDRNQQNQTLSLPTTPNYNQELLLEMQRQQLSLAQQIVDLEKRFLTMQKRLDQLAERPPEKPKEEKPKEAAPSKPAPRRP